MVSSGRSRLKLTSRLLLMLGDIGKAEVCHALLFGLGVLSLTGAGEAAVGSRGLEGTALSTIVQRSPGGPSRHSWSEKRVGIMRNRKSAKRSND